MLFFRQLELLKCLFQTFLLLTAVICLCQAGVIKKRDTQLNSASGNLTEVQPTILTAVSSDGFSASELVTTKLQSVTGTSFNTETSKELSNNEILLNEAKKLLEEEDKIINTNNETGLKAENETNSKEKYSEKLNENEDQTEEEENIKDIKEIIKNLENKEQNLSETSKSSAEFSSNNIKEDKEKQQIKDLDEKDEKLNSNHQEEKVKIEEKLSKESESESLQSSENSLKSSDAKPTTSQKTPIELRMESNADAILKTEVDSSSEKTSSHEENVIEQSKEKDVFKLETKKTTEEEVINQKENFVENNREQDTLKLENLGNSEIFHKAETKPPKKSENTDAKITNQRENFIETHKEQELVKVEESQQNQPTENSEINLNQKEHSNRIQTNFSETLEVLKVPVKTTNIKADTHLSGNKIINNIHDTIEGEMNNLDILATTLTPENDMDLAIFEGAKNQYARSMVMEDVSSEKPLTTVKPVVLSIKQGIEETTEAGKNIYIEVENPQNTSTLKEKKPKFINDNSTNAQQLNLPNNAEVWSLAAMRTLPKSNNSLETTQAHTEIFKKYKEEGEQQHTTPHNVNSTTMMSNISEKNLLDWSQIMMDKELSTTTRNEEYKQEDDANNLEISNSTTSQTNFGGDLEQKISTIPATTTLATILSFTNDDNNGVADKKIEENMNNHIELLREIQETTTATTTTTITTSVSLPLKATLNTEPNSNEELNLTLKQNTVDEPIIKSTTTTTNAAGKLAVDIEEASTLASTSSTITTSTEATAVDMTTVVVEQNSSETTTVSTLETSKQNTTSGIDDILKSQQQIGNNFNKNINEIEEESSTKSSHILENNLSENHTNFENNEFNSKSIILPSITIPTTITTVLPITTFRPPILAITSSTSSTSTPSTFEQEIYQNGNEIQTNLNENKQIEQQQSISTETTTTATTEISLHDVYNSTKAIETRLEAKQYEETSTTLETIAENTTTATTELVKKEAAEEDIKAETSTSFSFNKEEEKETKILSVTIGSKLDSTQTTETTPKIDDETTTGSPVVSSTVEYNKKEVKKELAIETTTAAATAENATKTPVVVIETQSVTTELKESSTTTTSTVTIATTEESVIETTARAIQRQESEIKTKEKDEKTVTKENDNKNEISTTITPGMSKSSTTTIATVIEETTKATEKTIMATTKDDETFISLLDDITTTTTAYFSTPSIETTATSSTTTTTNSTTTPQTLLSTSTTTTEPPAITTKIEEIYNVIHSTTTEFIQTTTPHLNAETEDSPASSTTTFTSFYPSTSSSSDMLPLSTTITPSTTQMIATGDISKSLPTLTSIMGGNSGNMYPKNTEASNETDVNVIIAITVSVIGVIALILLVGFLYIMRKRQKQTSYSQRCRPVSLDEYTIDNMSVGGSMRKSSALRSSKRTYGNLAFDDPSLRHNPMGVHELAKFVQEKLRIFEEFRDVPQITSRLDEVPPGCEDKNRYANVLPLPETRVILQRLNNDDKTEYINANYVTVDKFFKEGPKDPPNYYIACQAPLDSTVEDFWRMIWEQQSRVIIQATDLIENGVEKCAEYLPPSVTLDNHSTFGDFQITLQNREVKDKYAISTILLKNVSENTTRELTHYWYKWPEVGIPAEEAPIIAMLLEARSSLLSYAIEQANEDKEKSSTATLRSAEEGTVSSINGSTISPANNSNGGSSANGSSGEINGNISMVQIKKTARNQGPLTVHCSPGTGRTGTIIACDIAIRSLETPKRTVDIPQIVYYVRRGRASAVLTKEQYEFIYKVANMYAAKITNPTNYN